MSHRFIAIYDDRCTVCAAFSSLGRNILPVGYTANEAKKLMRAQFGRHYGFILMFFSSERVYWGSEAAAQITKQGYSKALGTLPESVTRRLYPFAVQSLTVLLRRKVQPAPPTVKRKKLPAAGSMLLTKEAKEQFLRLLARSQKTP